ncbi:MAG TPA: nuclear transport factor 2 family protein [Terracidiphilus sp.]|nr:nuclear transport factor 2 family protein [Terracidiphilus sp.]
MKKKVLFMLAALLVCVPGLRAADDEVAAPVIQFIEAFNSGNAEAAFATCAKGDIVIVDEFAPHVWVGPHAAQDWATDFDKNAKATGVTDAKVTYGKPFREEVNGDVAYIVMPTGYDYKLNGKPMHEDAQMTVVMVKQDGAWKIRSWTWGGEKPEAED